MSGITGGGITGGGGSSSDYLTSSAESATLPNSRNLVAGTNIAFIDTVPNVRTISSSGSGGSTVPTTVQGDSLYASAANTLTALAKDTSATRYVSNTGATNNPAWAQINLANGVTGDLPFANLEQGAALSVLGVTGNSIADVASIVAASDGDVLRRSGTSVGFGTITLNTANLANPTASVGLAAVNGTAVTAMRSDGAPALDQTIAPTMSGAWTFSNAVPISISSAEPRLRLNESDQGSDLKLWDFDLAGGVLTGRTRTDADGAGVNWLSVTRGATTAISNIALGNATNNPTGTWLGSGTFTFGGSVACGANTLSGQAATISALVTAGRVNVTSSGSVANGLNLPGTNRLGFNTNTTARGEFDAAGQFKIATVGAGLSVAEGSNAKMGVATLVAGTVVVSTTAVTASSRIFLTAQSLGTVAIGQGLAVSARVAGTSFTILSESATDTSVVAWMLVEPS